MMLQVGTVVQVLRGHNAPGFAVVTELMPKAVLLVDGRRHPLERPKQKNLRHIKATDKVLSAEQLQSNRQIRKALHGFCAATNNP